MRKLLVSSIMAALAPLASAQDTQRVTEILVIGVQDTHTVVTDDTLVAPADTAQMLRKMPGANINKNGELTGIAQYRGMFGDRISVAVDGAQISGAGPNAMDAPLSYAPVALLQSLTINRGIAPVSSAQAISRRVPIPVNLAAEVISSLPAAPISELRLSMMAW